MKGETTYFTANATILKQESVMDVINEIVNQPVSMINFIDTYEKCCRQRSFYIFLLLLICLLL